MFRCYSYTIIRERINSYLVKLHLLKESIKILRCVVNKVVVCLHILGPHWCLCVVLFGCRIRKKGKMEFLVENMQHFKLGGYEFSLKILIS